MSDIYCIDYTNKKGERATHWWLDGMALTRFGAIIQYSRLLNQGATKIEVRVVK